MIETSGAAAMLGHPTKRRILFAFVDRDRSLAEAATATGLALNLLHYHVERLVGLGLLQRRRKRPRAGRPAQLYRAVANAFLVPAALMPGKPESALHRELRAALDRQQADAYLYSVGENGRAVMSRAGALDANELWRVVQLDTESARELVLEIGRLVSAYAAKPPTSRAKPTLVHVAIARRRRPL